MTVLTSDQLLKLLDEHIEYHALGSLPGGGLHQQLGISEVKLHNGRLHVYFRNGEPEHIYTPHFTRLYPKP